jgi:YVTN family beta-propeller protein
MTDESWIHQQFFWVMALFGSPGILITVTWVFIQICRRVCCCLPWVMSCLQNNAPTVANAAAQNEGIIAKIKAVIGCVLQNISECFGTRRVLRGCIVGDDGQRIGGVWTKDTEPPSSGNQGDVETAQKREQDYPEKVMKNRDGIPFAGISPHGIVKSPDGQSIYLLDPVKQEICETDPTTNECVDTIPLDGRSTSCIVNGCHFIAACLREAMSRCCLPFCHFLVSCNFQHEYFDSCFSHMTMAIARSTPADEWHPDWLKITPNGNKFLVTYHHQNNHSVNRCVSIIDRKTKKGTPKFELSVSGEPLWISFTSNSAEAYLAMPEGRIVVIDLKKGEMKKNQAGRSYIEVGSDLQKVMVAPNRNVYSLHDTKVKRIDPYTWLIGKEDVLEGVSPENVDVCSKDGDDRLYFIDSQDGSIQVADSYTLQRIGILLDGNGNRIIVEKDAQGIKVAVDGSWIATLNKRRGWGNWIRVVSKGKAEIEAARKKAKEHAKEHVKETEKGREEEEKEKLRESPQSNHETYWNVNELSAYLYYHHRHSDFAGASSSTEQTQNIVPTSFPLPAETKKIISDERSLLAVNPERRRFIYSDRNEAISNDDVLSFCPHYMLAVPVDLNRQNCRLNTVALLLSVLCIGMAFVLNSFINPRMFSLYQMRLIGITLYLGTMSVIACLIMVITQKPFWKIVVIVLSVIAFLVSLAAVFVILMLASGYPQTVWEQMITFLFILLLVLLFLTWLAKKCESRGWKGFLFLLSSFLLLVVVTMAIAFFILLFISTDHTVLMTNLQRDRILVYDTKTKNVTAMISTGEGLSWLAVTPDKATAYVTNQGSGTVSVIDMATYQVKENITVGGEPTYVAVSSDGRTALVSISNETNGIVAAIDLSTNQVVANISVAISPEKIVWADKPEVARACVLSESGRVYVINTAINEIVEVAVNVGPSARDAAVDSVEMRAYVTSGGNDSVTVIEIGNAERVEVIPVGIDPWGLLLIPEEKLLYVANFGSDTVSVISTSNNSVIMDIIVGDGPIQLIANPDKTLIYVAEMNGEMVSVIDRETHQVIASIWLPTRGDVWGIAISPDSSLVVVTHERVHSITIITTLTDYAEEVGIDGNAYQAIFVN